MSSRRRRPFLGLLALNGVLLVALGAVTFAPKADAQAGRSRGTYAMVAGTVNGQLMPIVYIVDESNAELVGVTWDEQRRELIGMGYRNLLTDATEVGRARN
ncbi:MAG: hypothetical protein SGJ11_02335 [Phycisphaerae bacterium]|nr:hypothetical protein [Phycisphaerae bacterium]